MSVATLAPELEPYPNKYRLPVQAYHRRKDLGFLDERFEVLDGGIVSKASKVPPHRIAIILLQQWLLTLFDILHIQVEAPIALP